MLSKEARFQEELQRHVEVDDRVLGVLLEFLNGLLEEIDGVAYQAIEQVPGGVGGRPLRTFLHAVMVSEGVTRSSFF